MSTVILPFGNAGPSVIRFDNGNAAQLVYIVGDDGGPLPSGIGFGGASTPGSSVRYTPAAGGITNTTAVTIMPAIAGKTNTLRTLSVQNGNGVGTEVTINNGAGGPVIWRGYVPGNGSISATPMASGSVGALLEFQAVTTGALLYVNATGSAA